MSRYYSAFKEKKVRSKEGPAPGKRAKTPDLPQEKATGRFGQKANSPSGKHDAGFPRVKTHVAEDY